MPLRVACPAWDIGRSVTRCLLVTLATFGVVGSARASAAGFPIQPRLLGRPLTAAQQATVQEASARVSALITSGYAPVRMNAPAGDCDPGLPKVQETLTAFLVFIVVKNLGDDVYATGMPCDLRSGTYLPVYGVIELNAEGLSELPRADLLDTLIHELLHTLGVGTLWEPDERVAMDGESDGKNFVKRVGKAAYYTGPRAVAAYRALGGQAVGVPLDPDAGHWAGDAVCGEILSGDAGDYTGRVNPVSPITLGALEDLGYRVHAAPVTFRLPDRRGCQVPEPSDSAAAQAPAPKGAPKIPAGGFRSCAAARAAGAALPIRRNQPGYSAAMDGDGDGLACEGG